MFYRALFVYCITVVNVISLGTSREREYIRTIDIDNNSIDVPTLLAANTTVVSVYYSNMSGLLPGNLPERNNTILATGVISASLYCDTGTCSTSSAPYQPVIINLQLSVDLEVSKE